MSNYFVCEKYYFCYICINSQENVSKMDIQILPSVGRLVTVLLAGFSIE